MPATVEKLLGKPIAIVNYYGHVTVEDTRAVFAQVAGLVDTYGAPLYRLTCVNSDESVVSFDEVMMMTTLSSRGVRGSSTDPDVKTLLVGDHPLIDLFAQAMREEAFGGVDIPIFDSVDDALLEIYERMEQDEDTLGNDAPTSEPSADNSKDEHE